MKENLFAAAALRIAAAEVDWPFESDDLAEPLVLEFLKQIAAVS